LSAAGTHFLRGVVKDGFELWTQRFDNAWKDVFAIQDAISDADAEALKVRLGIKRRGETPRNADAYTAYLQGHHLSTLPHCQSHGRISAWVMWTSASIGWKQQLPNTSLTSVP
jgi:hypothetical protein